MVRTKPQDWGCSVGKSNIYKDQQRTEVHAAVPLHTEAYLKIG
jgi:hypothetical protein